LWALTPAFALLPWLRGLLILLASSVTVTELGLALARS